MTSLKAVLSNLLVIALYAAPILIYWYLESKKHSYPRPWKWFIALVVIAMLTFFAPISSKLMMIWAIAHGVVLLFHWAVWLCIISKRVPEGAPLVFLTIGLGFLVQISPVLLFFIVGNFFGTNA